MNQITVLVTVVLGAIAAGLIVVLHQLPAGAAVAVLAVLVFFGLKMANNWERFVILRAGRLSSVKGPGLFFMIPIVDSVAAVIDERIQTTGFNAEQALTRDTVPVNVDAIVFWMVHDPERAALEIADYVSAVQRVAQTSLREMIGSSVLSELLSERKTADATLKEVIGSKTAEWGVTVNSVLPGPTLSEGVAQMLKEEVAATGKTVEEVAAQFVQTHRASSIIRRAASVDEVANMIVYACSKEASATTGAALRVDGGVVDTIA